MIANIASDDALILPHRANPGRIEFSGMTGGSGLSLRCDNVDSVGELYPEDNFRQLAVAIEPTPTFLGGLGELEDHGERGPVRETSLGAQRSRTSFR